MAENLNSPVTTMELMRCSDGNRSMHEANLTSFCCVEKKATRIIPVSMIMACVAFDARAMMKNRVLAGTKENAILAVSGESWCKRLTDTSRESGTHCDAAGRFAAGRFILKPSKVDYRRRACKQSG